MNTCSICSSRHHTTEGHHDAVAAFEAAIGRPSTRADEPPSACSICDSADRIRRLEIVLDGKAGPRFDLCPTHLAFMLFHLGAATAVVLKEHESRAKEPPV